MTRSTHKKEAAAQKHRFGKSETHGNQQASSVPGPVADALAEVNQVILQERTTPKIA